MKRISFLVILFTISFWSCKTSEPSTPADVTLVASADIATLSKQEITNQISALSPVFALLTKNGIKAYKITYKTKNSDGQEVQASGAVILPTLANGDPATSMVSYQHGTIQSNADAPSNFSTSAGDTQLMTLLGALGYIVVAPDYIGYGASQNLPHTYEHRESLAQSSLDMIRAAKEFLRKNNGKLWDNKLYLTGYSEGGFATMSLLKKIEETSASEFNIRAVSAGAGAYNKTALMKALINNVNHRPDASSNRLYLWVLLTYNRIYGLNRPMSAYFKEPYASQIQVQNLAVNIPVSMHSIFTDAFKTAINNGTDTAFLNAVKDNDVFDWKPVSLLRLYHGDADELVPYFNTQNAFDAMIARGATRVTLFKMAGKTHSTGVEGFAQGTYEMLSTVK